MNWDEELERSLRALAILMRDERSISVYEIQSSGLVPALIHCMTAEGGDHMAQARARERQKIFSSAFADIPQEPVDLNSRFVVKEVMCVLLGGGVHGDGVCDSNGAARVRMLL